MQSTKEAMAVKIERVMVHSPRGPMPSWTNSAGKAPVSVDTRTAGQLWGRQKLEDTDPAGCTKILELRRQSLGMATIDKRVGVSSRTVWRFLREVAATSGVGVT
jgi:hypothetical protein